MVDEQPPTTAAGNADETNVGPAADETELVAPLTVPASELAWSHDEGADAHDYSWGSTAERASLILIAAAAVAVVIGLLMWLGFYLHDQTKPTPPAADTLRSVTLVPAAALPPITAAPAPVAAPPPSTVTVTPPAPPPATVTVQAAPPAPRINDSVPPPAADDTTVFAICPDGHEGVVGGHTSCAFAENVRRTFYATGMSDSFVAYSPVTGDAYNMSCAGRYPAYFDDGSTKVSTRCTGGDNAEVVIW